MDRRRELDKAIKRYVVPGERKALVRIPEDVLARLNDGLDDGLRILPSGRIQARYRGANKREVSRNFATLADARDWRAKGITDVARGDWSNPKAGKATVGDLYAAYSANKATLKAGSRADIAYLWDQQVNAWADEPVGGIKATDVQAWVRALTAEGHSRSVIRRCVLILGGILDVAVEHGNIAKSPVAYKSLSRLYPAADPHGANPLTLEQLDALVEHSSKHYAALTEFLARTGLRISEARELRVKDLRLAGKSPTGLDYAKSPNVRIDRACVTVQQFAADGSPITRIGRGGKVTNVYEDVVDTPKSGQRRDVPLTPRAAALAKAAADGKEPDDLLFTSSEGGRVPRRGFATSLTDATARAAITTDADQPVTPHSLRDTFATQALLSGASVIAVSKALGHRDAVITLQRYAGLLPQDTEALRAGLTAAERTHAASRIPADS